MIQSNLILFDVVDGELSIKYNNIAIPEFKEIWKRDKDRYKKQAFAELSYIYHICDFNSPYYNIPFNERDELVRKDFIKDKTWKPDAKLQAAIDKYKSFQETPASRFLKAQQDMIDKINIYMNNIRPEDIDEKILSAAMIAFEKGNKIIGAIPKLKESISKEQMVDERLRGGGHLGMYEE